MKYLFTDGAASANGKINCVATWGYMLVEPNGTIIKGDSGKVPLITISGKKYKTSNNRGELMAIIEGLKMYNQLFPTEQLIVVSDSSYSIKCITEWYPNWLKKGTKGKLNLDLLAQIDIANPLISYKHVNSHIKEEPTQKNTIEWFYWHFNDLVDKMCANAFF